MNRTGQTAGEAISFPVHRLHIYVVTYYKSSACNSGGDCLHFFTCRCVSAAEAVMLKLGDTFLEVFQFNSPEPQKQAGNRPVNNHGITHICLEVTDIQGKYERLLAAGVSFNCPPQHQDGSSMVYGRDPDGNIFELIEVTA